MGRQTYYYQNNRNALTGDQVAQIAYQAGFRGNDLVKAVAIAKRESGWVPNVYGSDADPTKYSGDRGLFQINYSNDAGLIKAGVISNATDLFNPVINARAAFYLYSHSGNSFAPAWSVGAGGWNGTGDPLYGTNVPVAQQAVTSAAQKGLFGLPWTDTLGNILTGSLGPLANWIPGLPNWNPGDIPIIGGPLSAINDINKAVVSLVKVLLDPSMWTRILQVVGGGIVFLLGLYVLVGNTVVGQQVTGAAKLAAVA